MEMTKNWSGKFRIRGGRGKGSYRVGKKKIEKKGSDVHWRKNVKKKERRIGRKVGKNWGVLGTGGKDGYIGDESGDRCYFHRRKPPWRVWNIHVGL